MLNACPQRRLLRGEAAAAGPNPFPAPRVGGRHSTAAPATHAPSLATKASRETFVCKAQAYGGRGGPQPPTGSEMALARRPYAPIQPQQPAYLNLSLVSDKQVITCNSGKSLGTIGEAWVDPQRLELVAFDLEVKRGVGSTVVGSVPLMALKQIGDVVLVEDEKALAEMPLDGRYGFVKLLGMEVRTRSGKVLGKVRDVSFSPDNGTISKVEFDDFGLRFLPVNFFDTFSISSELIDSVSMGCVLVATDERQRQEKQGILSSILRGTGTRPVAGLLSDGGYRSEAAGYLPQGYSYEQWQNDIRRWEAETGIRYEEYMSQNAGYGSRAARNALPSRTTASGAASGGPAARYALPAPAGAAPPQAAAAAAGRQWQPNQVAAGYGAQPGQLPGQQQQYGGDPRYRGGAPGGPPGQGRYPGAPPAQQQHQWGAQGPAAPAAPQQQWGQQQPQQQQTPTGWPAPGATPQQPPMQQQQRIQQAGGGPGPMGGGPGAGPRGPGPSPPQQQQQPQLPPQQQQQAYGRPGPDGSARGSMGAGAGTGNGMSSNGANGAMRVDEWLAGSGAREGLEVAGVELNGAGAGAKRPLAEAMGWDGMTAGSSNGRGPSY